jgi:uncharacterized protein YegP (UPF0339 family)
MKLIKGKKYIITGFKDSINEKVLRKEGIKFPQEVLCLGSSFFEVKDKSGLSHYFTWRFKVKEVRPTPTIEIYKSRGQFKFRVKGANSKTLGHLFNTKQGAKKGIAALKKALSNYKVIDLTK